MLEPAADKVPLPFILHGQAWLEHVPVTMAGSANGSLTFRPRCCAVARASVSGSPKETPRTAFDRQPKNVQVRRILGCWRLPLQSSPLLQTRPANGVRDSSAEATNTGGVPCPDGPHSAAVTFSPARLSPHKLPPGKVVCRHSRRGTAPDVA